MTGEQGRGRRWVDWEAEGFLERGGGALDDDRVETACSSWAALVFQPLEINPMILLAMDEEGAAEGFVGNDWPLRNVARCLIFAKDGLGALLSDRRDLLGLKERRRRVAGSKASF